MSSSQYPSSMNHLFERLKTLYFPETWRDSVKFVIQEFKFFDIFLSLQSLIDEPYKMLDVIQKVEALFEDALVDFSELNQAEFFDFYIFKVQNKVRLIKMEIRSKYVFPNISSLPLSDKFVSEFMDTVIENLGDPRTKEHINHLLRELKLLQSFVCFISDRFLEPQTQHHVYFFFTHVLAVAGHASMVAWLYFSGNENQDFTLGEINVSFLLEMKLKPIQPRIREMYVAVLQVLKSTIESGQWSPKIQNENREANFLETILHHLVELPPTNIKSSERDALRNHLEIILPQEMLTLLKDQTIHTPKQDVNLLCRDIDTVIDVGLLVYSDKEAMVPDLFNCILQRISSTVISLTIRKKFQSNLPRIHGLGYVDFLLNNLEELHNRYPDSLAYVDAQLQRIQKELKCLQPFLEVVSHEPHNDLNKVQLSLIGKAYELEYVIDACISKEAPVWCIERWLLDITDEIVLIGEEVADHEKKMVGNALMNVVAAHTSSNLARSPRMNEEIVGFEDVIEELRSKLLKGTKERSVIPIVGMPGLGKTTLACRILSDSLVVSHFDIRAQCCVSQVYSREDLFSAILRDVATGEDSKRIQNCVDHELADKLRKALISKRYLILIDDVWEANAWDDLIGCFPHNKNGSRIILTTRDHEVAEYASYRSDPFQLRMFNGDESWELLRKKVFGEESCPPSLKNVGIQIAKKCGHLPLSLALVSGILAEMEKKEECWQKLAHNLGPYIHKDSRAIIEQSYHVLPYHLRSCFLYFGAFLEDCEIDVSKLKRLWISEGFIKSCEGKSLEDTAEGYLESLFGRNLVMGTKRSSGGNIKACRIHDLLHDFCKERAKENNFLIWIQRGQMPNHGYHHKRFAHRLSICGEGRYRNGEWSSCSPYVGSIISRDRLPPSNLFCSFKFLKVADLERTNIGSFPSDLVSLRYFAARTRELSIAPFITNRWNLETLILHMNSRRQMSLPMMTLLEMVKLRHLHISDCSFIIENAEELVENSKTFFDLKTLSTPYFTCVQEMELILRKTPNLRELRCEIKGVSDLQYYVLKFPTWLETLKIHTKFALTIPFCIAAPNLKKLTLNNFNLHPRHLLEISLLRNLQVLKLKLTAFGDMKYWKVSSGEFPQLKVLKLQNVASLREWIVADDAFPKLECLVLQQCRLLKEIPSCFAEISSLKLIEIWDCNESVDKSARDIQETQVENYQNFNFQIFIGWRRKQ